MSENINNNYNDDDFIDPFNDTDHYDKKKNDLVVYAEAMTYQEPFLQRNDHINSNQNLSNYINDGINPQNFLAGVNYDDAPAYNRQDSSMIINDPFKKEVELKDRSPSSAAALFDSEDEQAYPQTHERKVETQISSFIAPSTIEIVSQVAEQELKSSQEVSLEQAPEIVATKTYVEPSLTNILSTKSKTGSAQSQFLVDETKIGAIYDEQLLVRINRVEHIASTERQLEEMKHNIKDKKALQKERNVKTAQLSRDRKKLEVEYLREGCIEMTKTLNMVRNALLAKGLSSDADLNFLFDQSSCQPYQTQDSEYALKSTNSFTSNSGGESGSEKVSAGEFNDVVQKPSLVNRISKAQKKLTRVSQKNTCTDHESQSDLNKRDKKSIGKRQAQTSNEDSQSSGGFSIVSPFGGVSRGGNKFARVGGLAVGSLMCLGMVAYSGQPEADFSVALYHEEGKRSLMENTDTNISNLLLSDPILADEQTIELKWGGGNLDLGQGNISDLQIYSPSEQQGIVKINDLASSYPKKSAFTGTLATPSPCKNFDSKRFIQQTYMVEEVREDFLNKQMNKLCQEESESTLLIQEEYAENAPVIYRPQKTMVDENLKPISWQTVHEDVGINTDMDQKLLQYSKLKEHTTTLFTKSPSLILPSDKNGNTIMNLTTPDDLEPQEQYMHIILPAKDINVLNPNSKNGSHFIPPTLGENSYVEIGCKIFEVNQIQYQPSV